MMMLTLNEFKNLEMSVGQMRKVCGGDTYYSETFNTPTGQFEQHTTMYDDGSFDTEYDSPDGIMDIDLLTYNGGRDTEVLP